MTRIFVRFTQAGFHYWPGAPDHRIYLADPHRHQFHFEVSMRVHHDERDVEFHDLIDAARDELIPDGNYGPLSCEAIASVLLDRLATRFPGRDIHVTVSEDGEAGATVTEDNT